MDKIFVTGATGFIGGRIVQRLVEQGFSGAALEPAAEPTLHAAADSAPNGGGPWQHERVELVPGDILDVDSLRRGMQGCDRVFHLAAYAKNWAPDRQTFLPHQRARHGERLLPWRRNWASERVVWTSTCVTLGPTPPGMVGDENMPRITRPVFHRI